jgi:hypothetical protein
MSTCRPKLREKKLVKMMKNVQFEEVRGKLEIGDFWL